MRKTGEKRCQRWWSLMRLCLKWRYLLMLVCIPNPCPFPLNPNPFQEAVLGLELVMAQVLDRALAWLPRKTGCRSLDSRTIGLRRLNRWRFGY
jgi:hypothetical protein